MPLKSPNLDDRDFDQLVKEAKRIIVKECPQWTDLSPGDPGIVILELFAHLTETMIYRLNRLPEKAYVEFLRLIGVKLGPPAAASARLRFTLSKEQDKPVEIPRGTRVTLARAGGGEPPPVFVVLKAASIPTGKLSVDDVAAYHCELVEGEVVRKADDKPGSFVTALHAPIVDATSKELELIVGVEDPDVSTRPDRALEHDGKGYAVWQEVEDFSNLMVRDVYCGKCGGRIAAADVFCAHCAERQPITPPGSSANISNLKDRPLVYVADRMTGTITFAPSARLKDVDGKLDQTPQPLAEAPKEGREIRLWYYSGGGLAGNVAANTLTTLKDAIPGVTAVTNLDPATGGSDGETLENALIRGPQQLHALQRAVTARDFKLLAERSSGAVARAEAYTKASLWKHGTLGTVQVLIVPSMPEQERPEGVVTEEKLKAHETKEAIASVQQSLDERKPLSTTCVAEWVRYQEVKVEARVVVHRGEDALAVKSRVLKRLHQTINPLPSSLPSPGWPFGQPLRVSSVYDIMLAEPGVSYVDNVRLLVDQAPGGDISALAADAFQPNTWYATTNLSRKVSDNTLFAEPRLFRSMDNGEGWELIHRFGADEETAHIRVNNFKPGQLAVVTNPTSTPGSRLYVSDDCGENWRNLNNPAFTINDLAWTSRGNEPVLIMATDKGLFELLLQPGAAPVGISVDKSRPDTQGFIAVAAAVGVRGTAYVAAAADSIKGVSVYLSTEGGGSDTYKPLTLNDENVSVLEVQQDGGRTFLWAGLMLKTGSDAGKGAARWELQAGSAGTHTFITRGWVGGSCHGLAFSGSTAFAATHDNGVLWFDLAEKSEKASWRAPKKDTGLKVRDDEVRDFEPVNVLAAAAQPATAPGKPPQDIVMAGGGPESFMGIYRSIDGGTSYQSCSNTEFLDRVTLSPTRLFCSGDHEVAVVSEDEAQLLPPVFRAQ